MTENDYKFKIFYKILYDSICQWPHSTDAQTHPQWMEWKRLEFAGLKPIQSIARITDILRVST